MDLNQERKIMPFFSSRITCSYTSQCLLYSKVNQLEVYIYSHFFGFPSHLGHHIALSRVPCALQYFALIIYFIHSINSVYKTVPIPQFLPPTPFPLGVHTFVL